MPFPRFLFLIANDSFLLQQEISKRIRNFQVSSQSAAMSPGLSAGSTSGSTSDSRLGSSSLHVFWGDDGLSEDFYDQLTLQGLFSQPKVLVLRNANLLPAASLKTLSNALNKAPQDAFIIICLEVPFERGKPKIAAHISKLPCYAFAEKSQWITTIPELNKRTISTYIVEQVKTLGVTLPQSLLLKLIDVLPQDAASINSELQKIALLADEQGQVPESAHTAIQQTLEGDIFRLLTAIQTSRQTAPVWQQLLEYNQSGESLIFAFLASLTREARNLWQLCMGERPAMPPSLIPAKKSLAQAMGPVGIAKLWELASTAERAIKTGEQSPEQAFDFLVAELSLVFHPTGH